jgi:hypothetical protein
MKHNSLFKTIASKQQLQKEQIMVTQEVTSYSLDYMKGNHIMKNIVQSQSNKNIGIIHDDE